MYTPLTRSRIKLTARETNQLAIHLTTDPTVRLRLIEGNRPLVIHIVGYLVRQWPALKRVQDDLLGAGFVGLVEAVNNLAVPNDIQNPSKYIGRVSRNRICEEAREHRAWKTTKQKPLGLIPDDILAIENKGLKEIDIQDMLAACCTTSQSQEIIDLRGQGHTINEIASQLEIPVITVRRTLQNVKRRLKRELQKNAV